MSYDVAVVGAGVHGVSATYHLAKAGARVVLLDRGYPADGPTGRSSAICRAYYTNPFLAAVAREALAWLPEFPATVGGESGFRRTGALYVHPPDDVADVETVASALTEAGTVVELLDPDTLRRRVPGIEMVDVGVAVWEPGAGYADPVLTTTSLLAAARDLGVTVRTRTEVRAIEPGGDGVEVMTASGDRLRADRVLLAAGPWTGPIAAALGVDLPLHAERHVVGTYVCGELTPSFVLADLAAGFYGKPEHGGQYLLGWLHEAPTVDPDDYAERITDKESLALIGSAVTRFPYLESVAPHGGWAGLYDVSPDWQPVIGEIVPNVFVHAGSSGHGFKLGPVLGRYVARLTMGERVPELAEFSPQRFAAGTAVAAGFGDIRIIG